jgi:beta-phosphoglucomutase-like phosphatase (HAD superfamily)
MTKAFIFDMDGVLVSSISYWHKYVEEVWPDLVGAEVAAVCHVPVGQTPASVYAEAVKHGSKVSKEAFMQKFDELAVKVYQEAPFTSGIEDLGTFLLSKNYKIGLISSSPKLWIDSVVNRLSFGGQIEAIISINDDEGLKPKPHPGSYIQIIDKLGARSETSIILEDSNSGIQAAKSAGVFTIGLTTNLLPEYTQHGADTYANTVEEIIKIVEDFDRDLVSATS